MGSYQKSEKSETETIVLGNALFLEVNHLKEHYLEIESILACLVSSLVRKNYLIRRIEVNSGTPYSKAPILLRFLSNEVFDYISLVSTYQHSDVEL